jgi:hypothetical protein
MLSSVTTDSADLKPFLATTSTEQFIQDNCHNRATHPIRPDFRTMDQSLEEPTVQGVRGARRDSKRPPPGRGPVLRIRWWTKLNDVLPSARHEVLPSLQPTKPSRRSLRFPCLIKQPLRSPDHYVRDPVGIHGPGARSHQFCSACSV